MIWRRWSFVYCLCSYRRRAFLILLFEIFKYRIHIQQCVVFSIHSVFAVVAGFTAAARVYKMVSNSNISLHWETEYEQASCAALSHQTFILFTAKYMLTLNFSSAFFFSSFLCRLISKSVDLNIHMLCLIFSKLYINELLNNTSLQTHIDYSKCSSQTLLYFSW